jgi:hypothetical protein
VANHAYLSLWLEDPSENSLLENFRRFLGTVPFSQRRPGFTELIARALSPAESPLLERDLRSADVDAGAVAAMVAEQLHSDSSYEVGAWWDLWTYNMDSESEDSTWILQPQPLLLLCNGEDYDDGIAREVGHIQADIGFEHFFTGHAGLLRAGGRVAIAHGADNGTNNLTGNPAANDGAHHVESAFVATMTREQHRNVYLEKTAANIHVLLDWAERARAALKVKRFQLWSEGEESFEARLEEILASR